MAELRGRALAAWAEGFGAAVAEVAAERAGLLPSGGAHTSTGWIKL